MGLIQPGTGYNFVNSDDGSSLEIVFPPIDYKEIQNNLLQQFQIVVEGDQLKVVNGTALWAPHWFNDDDRPDQPLCANQSVVTTYALYTGDNVVLGTDSSSPFMSEGGYVTLSP
jgi:hypothetical protein